MLPTTLSYDGTAILAVVAGVGPPADFLKATEHQQLLISTDLDQIQCGDLELRGSVSHY